MQNGVTSCLFSFVVEFANGFKMGGGGGGGGGEKKTTVAPKIARVVCLSHPCTFSGTAAREDRLDLQS